MRNWIKVLLKISAIVLVVGIALGALGFFLRKGESFSVTFENGKLVSREGNDMRVTLPKTTLDSFDVAEINVAYADIEFVATEDEYAIEYELRGKEPEYAVINGKLTFTQPAEDRNGVNFDFNAFSSGKGVIIYAPADKLSSIIISSSYGDVVLGGFDVTTVDLDLDYGDVQLSNLNVDGLLKIDSSYGDVIETGCTFMNIEASLSYGDVEFTDVAINGNANFNASSGDIEINLTNGAVSYSLDTNCGDISINGQEVSDGVEQSASATFDSVGYIVASDNYGDISINY